MEYASTRVISSTDVQLARRVFRRVVRWLETSAPIAIAHSSLCGNPPIIRAQQTRRAQQPPATKGMRHAHSHKATVPSVD
eukprot:scaffold49883_cov29-Tisochrysis_lutea.AAC.3